MAVAGILSSQIIHKQFVEDFPVSADTTMNLDLIEDRRRRIRASWAVLPIPFVERHKTEGRVNKKGEFVIHP